jgi:hypothetical protein
MKRPLVMLLGSLTLGLGVACSSSDGGGAAGSPGTAGSGTAGAPGTAGSSSAGGGSGGSSAGTGNGGSTAPEQCAPGTTHTAAALFDHQLTQCLNYSSNAAGFPNASGGSELDVEQLELPGGLVAGKPFALSVTMGLMGSSDFELWGSTGFCGAPEELLYKAPAMNGSICITLMPKAAHSNVLTVMAGNYTSFGYGSFTVCPMGSCPK